MQGRSTFESATAGSAICSTTTAPPIKRCSRCRISCANSLWTRCPSPGSWQRKSAPPAARSRPWASADRTGGDRWGHPFRFSLQPEEVELGLRPSAAHDIGKCPARPAGKGPAERSVPGVEKEVGVLRASYEWKIAGCGRSQGGPEFRLLRAPCLREPFEAALDERRAARFVHLGIVAVQLGSARHAQALAQPRKDDLAGVIRQARPWGFITGLKGQRDRVALYRIHRN